MLISAKINSVYGISRSDQRGSVTALCGPRGPIFIKRLLVVIIGIN